MPQTTRSKYEFHQEASLSQQLSNQIPQFRRLAGCDEDTSLAICRLEVLGKHGIIDMKAPWVKLMMDLLDAQRMAKFATSETVHEITKMGLMMPKSETTIDIESEEDDD